MNDSTTRLSAKERTHLRYALRSHPDVLSQVAKLSDISALSKVALLQAARQLGIDIEAAKAGSYSSMAPWDSKEGREQQRRSNDRPAFVGSFEEPMTFVLLGQSLTRTLRVSYEMTPPWPYIDEETGEEVQGWDQSSMRYDFLVHREVGLLGTGPYGKARRRREREEWVNCTELFMHEALGRQFDEGIDEKVEEACLRENNLRKLRLAKQPAQDIIWSFAIGTIVVICREQSASFVDPLVHKNDPLNENDAQYQALVDDVDAGRLKVTHMVATISRNGVEIGRGSRRDCVLPAIDLSAYSSGFAYLQELLSADSATRRRFRNQAVRQAISDARDHLADD